jgi:hypothetical protein
MIKLEHWGWGKYPLAQPGALHFEPLKAAAAGGIVQAEVHATTAYKWACAMAMRPSDCMTRSVPTTPT